MTTQQKELAEAILLHISKMEGIISPFKMEKRIAAILPLISAHDQKVAGEAWDMAENRIDYVRENQGWDTVPPDRETYLNNIKK